MTAKAIDRATLTPPTRGKFVREIETKGGRRLPVLISEAGAEGARYWHQRVQPHIINAESRQGNGENDAEAQSNTHGNTQGNNRLDRHWNWPGLYQWTMLLERLNKRRVVLLQMNVELADGDAFPVGQVLLSDGYPFIRNPRKPSVFLWFLAGAPRGALQEAGLPVDLKLMRPLIDVAIQFSFMSGYEGRISLHAARSGNQEGDEKLYNQYGHIGLKPHLGKLGRFIRFVTLRQNDGRYFYADEQKALDLSQKLDYLR